MTNCLVTCLVPQQTLQAEKDAIVNKHNDLRRRVAKGLETLGVGGAAQPKATDMFKLSWDDELAKVAQGYEK